MSTTRAAKRSGSGPPRHLPRRGMRRKPRRVGLAVFACVLLGSGIAAATPIQRDIVVDGNTAEWKVVPDVTTNPGQNSTDPTTFPPDLDEPQATGRDLATFAYTWNDTDLFLWVERAGSASNKTYWWFYIDTGGDGDMDASDLLLLVTWQGNTGALTRTVYSYTPIRPGGDPLVCPAFGVNSEDDGWCPQIDVGDGYDMPGGKVEIKSLSAQSGGLPNGLEMETSVPWSELGPGGPVSVSFHIAASNGQNIPTQLDDNMDGPMGGTLTFIDLEVTKVSSVTTALGNSSFTYTINIANNHAINAANNVDVLDALPANLSLQTAVATQGAYVVGTGIWTIGTLAAGGGSASLTLTVLVDDIASASTETNTASTNAYDEPDLNLLNNSEAVDVDLVPGPKLTVTKTTEVVTDGYTTTGNDKSIPGATVRYTVTVENSSTTAAAESVIITDPIPADTTYVADSMILDGTPQGDGTGDGDDSDFGQTTTGVVTSDIGALATSTTVTLTFDVTVD